jgi:serine/threonine protein kinase
VAALGAGALGEVYRAHDTRIVRDVALKVLRAHVTHDASRIVQFQSEARAASLLNHLTRSPFSRSATTRARGSTPLSRSTR